MKCIRRVSAQLRLGFLSPLLLCAALAGCATTPATPPPPDLFNDASFAAPAVPVDPQQAFAMSEAMRYYLRVDVAREARNKNPRRALAEALRNRSGLQLEYDAAMTRTAAQAFDARSGNCLSLVLMTAALAKEMGLDVHYQLVLGEESWSRSGGMYFVAGHVNLALERRAASNTVGYDADAILLIDFLPGEDLAGQRTQQISEATILAMYLNNRAAETMASGELDQAYWYARAAILQDPTFAGAFNTLGIIQLRHGDTEPARRTLAYALERSPSNTVLLSNLAQALDGLGRAGEAQLLRRKLLALQPEPPFHFFNLGQRAMEAADYQEAARLFKREITRDPYYHEFHFWLAQAYARMGQLAQAGRQLELAMDNSTTRGEHGLYAAKLQRLRAAGAH
ncbi:tetratricopeptide repeat protein [Janthinobacterium sp. SUN026]|uniref:tetratricopeptide repeat protein n=1 Tax=Janthinobacterium sp. SUN026 TaxID=3002438 RepID=UPI0025B0788C|nr:tetratricopeptide repeat protein [Janthinobacterium sp. SUN026]MDN2670584.1 tetratricopeptide repeat protein [Janthinobacterium sp. SUN026]